MWLLKFWIRPGDWWMSENVQKFRVLRLQRYPMLVDGTMIDFMVDCEPRMTDLVFESTWSQGIEYQKTGLCRWNVRRRGGRALKHALLCSETCPVPLMARDLMCKLNLKLTAGPFGIYWRVTADELCKILATVGIWVADKRFWLGTNDFEIGKDRTVSANTERMLPDRLHSLIYAYINMRKSG